MQRSKTQNHLDWNAPELGEISVCSEDRTSCCAAYQWPHYGLSPWDTSSKCPSQKHIRPLVHTFTNVGTTFSNEHKSSYSFLPLCPTGWGRILWKWESGTFWTGVIRDFLCLHFKQLIFLIWEVKLPLKSIFSPRNSSKDAGAADRGAARTLCWRGGC